MAEQFHVVQLPRYLEERSLILDYLRYAEHDNVYVNLPINLVKAVLKVGTNIAENIPEAEKYVKDINVDLLIEAIENELDGEMLS
jgi:hypothetical protein